MRFQAPVKVDSADAGVNDGEDDEDDGDDGEGGEGFSYRFKIFASLGLVHPHQFEEEVG